MTPQPAGQLVPVPPPTIVVTVPVLDQKATDAVTSLLYELGYNQLVLENVTRITAHKPEPPDDAKTE